MDEFALDRRRVLQVLAGGVALAAGLRPAVAGRARIDRLILSARALSAIGKRIDRISRAYVGTPYRGHTLIGGPHRRERLVVRDDCFDCVTFCETVLAAARSMRPSDFVPALRRIRYRHGVVDWAARNHYFSEWAARNIAEGICAPVAFPGSVVIKKRLSWDRALAPRRASFAAIPCKDLLAHRHRLATGDIIGFLSQRPRLDYFHIGFVVIGRGGELLLRHASLSHSRVLDERLAHFLAANRVRWVTLLRPLEPRKTTAVLRAGSVSR